MTVKKHNIFVGGIECDTPAQFIKGKLKEDNEIKEDIKKKLPQKQFYSKVDSKPITIQEKQSEENEDIAWQRLKTDAHRDYKGNFTWLLFKARRELTYAKSEPTFFSRYGGIFQTQDLPHLLDLCWELEVYGHCIFYDQKRYPDKELKALQHHFREANNHIQNARDIIKQHKDDKTNQKNTKQYAMFGRSLNTGITFQDNLVHELEILEFELDDLLKITRADRKLPKPRKDQYQVKLQYFIYLAEEIFKRIAFNLFFPNLDLTKHYDKACKDFVIQLSKVVYEISGSDENSIANAYDRKKKYKMQYLGLFYCKTPEQFTELLNKMNL